MDKPFSSGSLKLLARWERALSLLDVLHLLCMLPWNMGFGHAWGQKRQRNVKECLVWYIIQGFILKLETGVLESKQTYVNQGPQISECKYTIDSPPWAVALGKTHVKLSTTLHTRYLWNIQLWTWLCRRVKRKRHYSSYFRGIKIQSWNKRQIHVKKTRKSFTLWGIKVGILEIQKRGYGCGQEKPKRASWRRGCFCGGLKTREETVSSQNHSH